MKNPLMQICLIVIGEVLLGRIPTGKLSMVNSTRFDQSKCAGWSISKSGEKIEVMLKINMMEKVVLCQAALESNQFRLAV
jgi:hypothetical protein